MTGEIVEKKQKLSLSPGAAARLQSAAAECTSDTCTDIHPAHAQSMAVLAANADAGAAKDDKPQTGTPKDGSPVVGDKAKGGSATATPTKEK